MLFKPATTSGNKKENITVLHVIHVKLNKQEYRRGIVIKNWQSRETGNIGGTQDEEKQNDNPEKLAT